MHDIHTFTVVQSYATATLIKNHKARHILRFIYPFSKYGPCLVYLIYYPIQKHTFTVSSWPSGSHYTLTLDKCLHIHENWYTVIKATLPFLSGLGWRSG